jgi:hypothetical protein
MLNIVRSYFPSPASQVITSDFFIYFKYINNRIIINRNLFFFNMIFHIHYFLASK